MKISFNIPLWKQAPLIKYIIPFCMGIIFQDNASPEFEAISFLLLISFSLGLLFVFISAEVHFRLRFIAGFNYQLIIFFLGCFLYYIKDIRTNPNWYGHHQDGSVSYKARITEPLVEKEKTYKATVEIIEVNRNGKPVKTRGPVLLYFLKNDSLRLPLLNESIYFKKPLANIRNPGNPGEFNYQKFAAKHQQYHQQFLKHSEFGISEVKPSYNISSFLFITREHILAILKKHFRDPKVLGIAEALLIGYKNDLDKTLVKAYSVTGIVHIIAISGLHLGLIYWLLEFLCRFLSPINRSAWLKFAIIVSSLWLFALLTGGSASVLRSALMFTFIILGKEFFHKVSVYNSISCSAFILLCYDPNLLWDAGFQLSYLAVIGIVWLQVPIYKLWYIKNKWIDRIWSMASVTLSAQIMAFPVCIFYFHQFPNLFLIANLIEVPVSTIVLFAEILLILFSGISFLAGPIASLIKGLILFMNFIAEWLAGVPFALWDNLRATLLSTFILYFLIYFLISWIRSRYYGYFRLFLVFSLAFTACFSFLDIVHSGSRQLIIYNFPRTSVVEARFGNKCTSLRNSHPSVPEEIMSRSHADLGIMDSFKVDFRLNRNKNHLLKIGGLKMLWINKAPGPDTIARSVDLVLISHNPKIKIAELCRNIRPSMIVFDNSNSLWKIEKWKTECEELILPCHSTSEQGAFITDIP